MSTPLPHCDYCPLWLSRLDGCPLLNISDILYKSGTTAFTPLEIFQIYWAQNMEFHLDIVLALISLWVYIQSLIIFVQFISKPSIRTFAPLLAYGFGKIMCDLAKVLVFAEARPDGSCSPKFGLPSCHSLLAGQQLAWVLAETFYYPKSKMTFYRIIQCSILVMVPYSRIYLIYHTKKQVIYGLIFGTIIAISGILIVIRLEKKYPKYAGKKIHDKNEKIL